MHNEFPSTNEVYLNRQDVIKYNLQQAGTWRVYGPVKRRGKREVLFDRGGTFEQILTEATNSTNFYLPGLAVNYWQSYLRNKEFRDSKNGIVLKLADP